MVDYKRILRLRAEGVSQRGIADVMGCSRNTVSAVFTAADTAGIGFEQVADLGADEVRRLLLPEPVKADSGRVTPDFEHVHRELARPSVTLLLLWNEYVAASAPRAGCRIGTRSSMNSTAGGWHRRGRRCTSSASLASRSRSTGRAIRWASPIR